LRVTACDVDLLLRLAPELFESRSKRTQSGYPRHVSVLPRASVPPRESGELPFCFLADLRGDLLRSRGDCSLLLLRGRTQDLLSKVVQLGFEMLTQAWPPRRQSPSGSDRRKALIGSTDYTVSHGKYLQQLSFGSTDGLGVRIATAVLRLRR
jgi:hypothetical protein